MDGHERNGHERNGGGAVEASKRRLVSRTYLREAWYVALWSEDLAPGQILARTILNRPLVFFRREDGTIAALTDRCAHRAAPLRLGKLLPGGRVQCPYHGLEFGGDGACVLNPHGDGKIAPSNRVRAYKVVERHRAAWIWMGEGAPDPALIPDFGVLDTTDELAITKRDHIVLRANYELVTDNLLDLSHTSYLHDGILGNAGTVDAEIVVTQEGDSVSVARYSESAPIPGMFAPLLPGHPNAVQKWNFIRWMAPSNLLLQTGVAMPGVPREQGTGYWGIHFLTPETDATTHYHFTAVRWNVQTKGEALNRELIDKIGAGRLYAFAEQDAPVIEAQQAAIDQSPDPVDMTMLSIDVGPMRYKRILERLIREEERGIPAPV